MFDTWTCMICQQERPDAMIGVTHRPLKGLEDLFPDTRFNVRHCLDNKSCIEAAKVYPPL